MSVGLLTALSLLTVVRRITRQGFLLGQKPLLALKKSLPQSLYACYQQFINLCFVLKTNMDMNKVSASLD